MQINNIFVFSLIILNRIDLILLFIILFYPFANETVYGSTTMTIASTIIPYGEVIIATNLHHICNKCIYSNQ